MITDKDLRIKQFLADNPDVTMEYSFLGSVMQTYRENGQDKAWVRLNNEFDNTDEFEGEMNVSMFPQKDFKLGIIFWLFLGKKDGKEFNHISYFYWEKEDLEKAMKNAEVLAEKMQKCLFL